MGIIETPWYFEIWFILTRLIIVKMLKEFTPVKLVCQDGVRDTHVEAWPDEGCANAEVLFLRFGEYVLE